MWEELETGADKVRHDAERNGMDGMEPAVAERTQIGRAAAAHVPARPVWSLVTLKASPLLAASTHRKRIRDRDASAALLLVNADP